MKKYLLSVACLLASVGLAQANQLNGVPMAGDCGAPSDYYGARVSTVTFSSAPVQAFVGRGVVIGFGCSTTTIMNFFELFDTSLTLTQADFADASDIETTEGRIGRFAVVGLSTGGPVMGGDIKLPVPIRIDNGLSWMFSDQNAQGSRVYFWKPNQ